MLPMALCAAAHAPFVLAEERAQPAGRMMVADGDWQVQSLR